MANKRLKNEHLPQAAGIIAAAASYPLVGLNETGRGLWRNVQNPNSSTCFPNLSNVYKRVTGCMLEGRFCGVGSICVGFLLLCVSISPSLSFSFQNLRGERELLFFYRERGAPESQVLSILLAVFGFYRASFSSCNILASG